MHKQYLLPILVLFVLGLGNLSGQELTPSEKAEMHKKYWSNQDVALGAKAARAGNQKEAGQYYRKAIKTFEVEKNWEAFIRTNAVIAKTNVTAENYQEVIDLAWAAREKIKKKASEFEKFSICLYHNIGEIYNNFGKHDLAMATYREELKILQAYYDDDSHLDFLFCYNYLGDQYSRQGDLDSSFYYFLKAEIVIQNISDRHTNSENWYERTDMLREASYCYQMLSRGYRSKGNNDLALKCAKQGLDFAVKRYGQDAGQLYFPYCEIGYSYIRLGEYEKSAEYYKKALFVLENNDKGFGDTSKEGYLADAYGWLGYIYNCLDLDDEALIYQRKELEILEKGDFDIHEKINAVIGMGRAYMAKGDHEMALEFNSKADSLLTKFEREDEEGYDLSGARKYLLWNFAEVWRARNDLKRAKNYYKASVKLAKTESENIGVYGDLSNLYLKLGKRDSAFFYNQKALLAVTKNFAPDDYSQLPAVKDLITKNRVYFVLRQRAMLLQSASLATEDNSTKKHFLQQALSVADLTDQFHIENLKKLTLLRGGQSRTLVEISIDSYQEGLSSAHDLYQLDHAKSTLEKGFYCTQRMKAQQLWLSLLNSNATKFGQLSTDLLEKEKDLWTDIQYYEKKVLEAREKQDSATADLYENTHLFESKLAYNALIQEMEIKYPEYYEAKYNFVPETSETLQGILTENELLIEYVFADGALFIFTLASDYPLQVQKIPLDTQTTAHISTFNNRLQSSSWMRRSSREQFIDLAHALYQQFLQPIEDQLFGKDRLVIIGDGMTNYIPFEVLLPSDEIKSFRDLDYLIKKHEVSYHYSANLFAKARKEKATETSGIFAFAPVYEKADQTVALIENNPSPAKANTLRAFDNDGHFAPLPESEREVKDILALFDKTTKDDNTLALRAAANEWTLKSNLEKPYRFVHIAGHSFADLENPKFSGIACFEQTENAPDSTAHEDGILYTGEIYNLSTQADLVTLSSCESGYGKLQVSEGILGLNRAFIYVGTPNVVFSLWKVYDKVSAELMVNFYQNILAGKTYAASLRQAKLNLLKKEVTALPHFWGPYLLIGR